MKEINTCVEVLSSTKEKHIDEPQGHFSWKGTEPDIENFTESYSIMSCNIKGLIEIIYSLVFHPSYIITVEPR